MRRLALLVLLAVTTTAWALELESGDNLAGLCADAYATNSHFLEEAKAGEKKVDALLNSKDIGYLLRDPVPLEGLANFYNELPKPETLTSTLAKFEDCKKNPPKRLSLNDLEQLILENERFSATAFGWSVNLPTALEQGIATAKRRHPKKLLPSESPAAVAKAFSDRAASGNDIENRAKAVHERHRAETLPK